MNSYLYIKYNEKIYKIYCASIGTKEKYFIRVNKIEDNDILIDFNDVINYFKEKNIEYQKNLINLVIDELLKECFSSEKIEELIKNILSQEKENPKQKVKTYQK